MDKLKKSFTYLSSNQNKQSFLHLLHLDKYYRKLIMFLRHRPHHLQPPASNIFIAFFSICIKNPLYIINCQFGFQLLLFYLFLDGWFISGTPTGFYMFQKLQISGNYSIHHFYKQKFSKSKNKKPPCSNIF